MSTNDDAHCCLAQGRTFANWSDKLQGTGPQREMVEARFAEERKFQVTFGKGSMALAIQTLAARANGSQVVKSFRYLLTDPRQFDILQSGPGWRGLECNSID